MRIIRPINCLIACLAVFIGIFISSNYFKTNIGYFDVFLSFFSAFFITAAGNTINDYYDYEIDKLNAPKRPLPSGELSEETALFFSFIFFGAGIYSCFLINLHCFALGVFNSILLFYYAKKLKGVPLLGNLSVGYLVGSTFLFGGLVVGVTESIFILFLLSTLATVGTEIAKDIEDIEGDKKEVRTIATVYGKKNSSYLAAFFTTIAVLLSPLPFLLNYLGFFYIFCVSIGDLFFISALVNLLKNKDIKSASFFQKYSKIGMVISLFSFLVGDLGFFL